MPIDVTCPGCHKRFKVSDKFAGKEGPCPSCKAKIKIPALSEQVVVHAPEAHGPKDASGRPVLKPISRKEAGFSILAAILLGLPLLGAFILALVLRASSEPPSAIALGLAATILGPVLSWGGYAFLRNDELEPYRGIPLLIRSMICGLVYAALWGGYALLRHYLFDDQLEIHYLIFVVPPFVVVGALVCLASLDLDFGNSALHYGFYVLVTALLGWLAGVPLY